VTSEVMGRQEIATGIGRGLVSCFAGHRRGPQLIRSLAPGMWRRRTLGLVGKVGHLRHRAPLDLDQSDRLDARDKMTCRRRGR